MSDILLAEIRDTLAALLEKQTGTGEALPRYMGIERAAAHVDLSGKSIKRLLAAGKLVAHRPVRGRVLVDRLQLESYVAGSVATLRKARGGRRQNA